MKYADTSYFIALLNTRDQWHSQALAASQDRDSGLVSTTWVLMELGNALGALPTRRSFIRFVQSFVETEALEIVPADQSWFERGFNLYQRRPDKAWSMTDCISFLVMWERGITEALTSDKHFAQAGFKALLRKQNNGRYEA